MKKRNAMKAEDWPLIIEAWEKSGLPKKQFCQQRHISYKTFHRWYHKLHQPGLNTGLTANTATPSLAGFIPVTVSGAGKKTPGRESYCTLLLTDKLQLQIPVEVLNAPFLQMLLAASGGRPC